MKKMTLAALFLLAVAPFALAQGTYTQVDYPGAYLTSCAGIDSAGDVVGSFEDTNLGTHGFFLSGGLFTRLDAPGALYTEALGINDFGQIVGFDDTGSFLYDVASQIFTQFDYPRSNSTTIARAINNAGTIVGSIQVNGTSGPTYGFELNDTKYTKVAYPKLQVPAMYLTNINSSGEAIVLVLGRMTKSLLYSQHKFASIDIPGISSAIASGLNDQGAIAGYYNTALGVTGFVFQNNSVQQLAFPGSNETYAYSINNSGEILGFFNGSDFRGHGFTWTPDAPAEKK